MPDNPDPDNNPLGGQLLPWPGFADRIMNWGEKSGVGSVSPKGAVGKMQTMPGTLSSPGFGVRPAADDSPAENERVGRDYANALLQHYDGNETLASAAYNAGPGRVNQWIQQNGDPRTGGISDADWANKIPFDETKNYVPRVLGTDSSGPGLPVGEQGNILLAAVRPTTPTANQTDIGQTTPQGPNPLIALQMMRLLTPNSHQLQTVDYNPFKPGMPGAPAVG